MKGCSNLISMTIEAPPAPVRVHDLKRVPLVPMMAGAVAFAALALTLMPIPTGPTLLRAQGEAAAENRASLPPDIPLEDQFEVMLDALLLGDDPFDQLPQSAVDILRYTSGFPGRAYFSDAYGAHLYSLSQQMLRSTPEPFVDREAGSSNGPQLARGLDILVLSAATDYAPAQLDLGARYARGEGVAQDFEQARRLFERAAEAGSRDAQFNLALMFDLGQGVAADAEIAADWYHRAATADDPEAQFRLATLYQQGEGVMQNWGEAIAWYQRAVAAGSSDAAYNLALMYKNGEGVTVDLSRARTLLAKAALSGDKAAQAMLFEMFTEGTAQQEENGE